MRDLFTYTVDDGRGGTANGTVTVQVVWPLNVSGASGTNGFTVNASPAVAGVTYLLQVTTNLAAPGAWQTIATNVPVSDGAIQFLDAAATNAPTRLYRTLMPRAQWGGNSQ